MASQAHSAPTLWHTIDLLRCILMVFVVVIHTNLVPDSGCYDTTYSRLFSYMGEVLWLCNALFFTISGYLFFRSPHGFSSKVYTAKLRRRVRSLLVPYLLWNTLVLLLYAVVGGITGMPMGHDVKQVWEMSLPELFSAYYGIHGTGWEATPIDGPLWFLRNLMVLSLLAPLFYVVVRVHRFAAVILLAAVLLPVDNGTIESVVYYGLGCWLAVWGGDLERLRGYRVLPLLISFVVIMVVQRMIAMPYWLDMLLTVAKRMLLMFSVTVLGLNGMLRVPRRMVDEFSRSLFFVFALHGVVARVFVKASVALLLRYDMGTAAYVVAHVLCAITTIVLCVVFFKLVYRVSPTVCRILGARLT